MRHKAFTFVQAVALLASVGLAAFILFPIFFRGNQSRDRPTCHRNLKLVGLGMLQYTQDYDGTYPLVASNLGGWVDNIEPYIRSHEPFHCREAEGDKSALTTDYFYNSRLAGMTDNSNPRTGVFFPATTIMVGDGFAGGPTDSNLKSLPKSWRTNPDSPFTRHYGMANYLFADGHVKPMKPDAVDDSARRKSEKILSFAVR